VKPTADIHLADKTAAVPREVERVSRQASRATVRILRRYEECQSLQMDWSHLLGSPVSSPFGMDMSATFEWTMAVWRNHLEQTDQTVLVVEAGGKICSVLPLHATTKRIHGFPCRMVSPITEIFSGRCGFLVDEPQAERVETLLASLRQRIESWDIFAITLVEGSAQYDFLPELAGREKLQLERLGTVSSPYLELCDSWEEFEKSLSKKFRSILRKIERNLRTEGTVTFRELSKPDETEEFGRAVLEIERQSWKEAAGTSLTKNLKQERFHADWMQVAAAKGWFRGYLLELNGIPIAYQNGSLYNNTFYGLKTSYKDGYRRFAPGNLVQRYLVERLCQDKVAYYDHMGICDSHKMEWTDKFYTRSTFVLYKSTLRGWAARHCGALLERFRSNSAVSATPGPPSE
jgi:CelD/BcsL family acetyltransferase involved in cellulose biosynthesis